jgi:hypothetical protein
MIPAWLKLIEQWRAEGNMALAIPFLVGALQEWPGQPLGDGSGNDQLRALLASVRDYAAPDGTRMRLYTCNKLNDLALAPVTNVPTYCLPLPSAEHSDPFLYVEEGVIQDGGEPFDVLVNTLWLRYAENIEAKRFSIRDGLFHTFNQADRGLIARALQRPDDHV